MEIQQDSTTTENQTDVSKIFVDSRFQSLVDFKALNGLVTNEEGGMVKRSMQWLADMLNVDRGTLYNWMKLPGFWEEVNKRRLEISPKNRLSSVHEVWFLSAMQPGTKGFQDRQLWLANFDENFRTPTQNTKVEVTNSWSRLLGDKRNAVEGTVIPDDDEQQTNNA